MVVKSREKKNAREAKIGQYAPRFMDSIPGFRVLSFENLGRGGKS